MANIVIINNLLGYIIHDNKLNELQGWLGKNGEVADRELTSRLANKPLAPDLSIDPELRCPLGEDIRCELMFFRRKVLRLDNL